MASTRRRFLLGAIGVGGAMMSRRAGGWSARARGGVTRRGGRAAKAGQRTGLGSRDAAGYRTALSDPPELGAVGG